MNAIEILMNEHRVIEEMLTVLRKLSLNILNGSEIEVDDFRKIIVFIRNYADDYHHKKEEDLLFNVMIDEMGTISEKLVKHGMLVEHDLGRLYIKQLEEALNEYEGGKSEAKLDIVGNIYSYMDLLKRHISKEDNTVYTFAERSLDKSIMNEINNKCLSHREENLSVEKEALDILETIKNKYI